MIYPVELAEKMKAEIIRDAGAGIVPRTVASFAELHDWVDANLYGDFDVSTEVANEAMDLVDAWIKAGGLRDLAE